MRERERKKVRHGKYEREKKVSKKKLGKVAMRTLI